MGNSFNISVKPEIAALEAKIDIIDTEVDAIRATDLPAIDVLIDTIDTEVDAIRATDLPAIDVLIDTIDTEVGVIDGIVDAIKIKTDATPQNVRGHFTRYFAVEPSITFSDVCNITGHGILNWIILKPTVSTDTLEMRITIDGIVSQPIDITDAATFHIVKFADQSLLTTDFHFKFVEALSAEAENQHIEFDTSFRVEHRISAGSDGQSQVNVCVSLDAF
ncbi:hypothetical protein ES705_14429 [subsurface metagenome]